MKKAVLVVALIGAPPGGHVGCFMFEIVGTWPGTIVEARGRRQVSRRRAAADAPVPLARAIVGRSQRSGAPQKSRIGMLEPRSPDR
jgi:hypothetical protein